MYYLGNQHFVAGDDIEAIESYTKSLAYANTNELMAYAHANRSAALYRKQMYKECLADIDTALELGYPKEKREKLKQRGVKALAEVKKLLAIVDEEENKIAVQLNGNEKSQDNSDTNCPFKTSEDSLVNKKFPLISAIEKEETKEKKEKSPGREVVTDKFTSSLDLNGVAGTSVKPRHLQDPDVLTLKHGPSKEAPAMSAGVRISYSPEYGRHLVATREYKPGDLITIENPYSWVLYQDK